MYRIEILISRQILCKIGEFSSKDNANKSKTHEDVERFCFYDNALIFWRSLRL